MELKTIDIHKFLDEEYSSTALYSCFRSIASYVDGLKPSSRKVVYTARKQNITKDFKVSRFASSIASETEYLHGEGSLQGVITNLSQDFVGTNNIPLLEASGNFGTRFVPIASAARYIYSKKGEMFDGIFNKEDDPILISQEFEGNTIEPRFFVPILPLILLNGSEGVGTGYAQKILPRDPAELKRALSTLISGKTPRTPLRPYFEGFRGSIVEGEQPNSWEISGLFERKNTTTLYITELPIGYNLASYSTVLKELEDDKTIQDFKDLSEDDNFLFEVKVTRVFSSQKDEKILKDLKLIKRVTENFTCIDENNSIRVFETPMEVLQAYFDIRMPYYEKRREHLLEQTKIELDYLKSTEHFVKCVVDGKILLSKKTKVEIEKQLEGQKKILKKEGSYQYLLRMPLYSLSKERIQELQKDKRSKEEFLNYLIGSSGSDLWRSDLREEKIGSKRKETPEFFVHSKGSRSGRRGTGK